MTRSSSNGWRCFILLLSQQAPLFHRCRLDVKHIAPRPITPTSFPPHHGRSYDLRLEGLPAEILHILALDVRDYHIPSFVALASTSKTLRAAYSPILFSAIGVEPPCDKIEATVSRCEAALSFNGLSHHVRHLSLQVTPPRSDWTEPRRPLTNFSRLPGTAEVDLDILMAIVRPRTRNTDILYDDYDDTDAFDDFDEDDGNYADVYRSRAPRQQFGQTGRVPGLRAG